MNPDLERLQPYPFEKLRKLFEGTNPPAELPHIALSIGEPKHNPPSFVADAMMSHMHGLASYPITRGSAELREAIAGWLRQRFGLKPQSLDAGRHILPVNGTREALFAFAQAVVARGDDARVLMPNPFYQIYEGAALLAGATPYFYDTTAENGFLPDFDAIPEDVWQRCQLLYVCTPGNPTGAVLDDADFARLIELSDRFGFVIASDECYSELYFDEDQPPQGLLGACARLGRDDYKNCVVFHSLSKRSNLPGLRSGFVAGDAEILDKFHLYRTYHGCTMSPPTQAGSIAAWQDEHHVAANRDLYRDKFEAVLAVLEGVLDVQKPAAGFYLWPKTPIDDTEFARRLYDQQNVTVLPGSYLSRDNGGSNPGAGHVRMALVAPLEECVEAAHRIRALVENL